MIIPHNKLGIGSNEQITNKITDEIGRSYSGFI